MISEPTGSATAGQNTVYEEDDKLMEALSKAHGVCLQALGGGLSLPENRDLAQGWSLDHGKVEVKAGRVHRACGPAGPEPGPPGGSG